MANGFAISDVHIDGGTSSHCLHGGMPVTRVSEHDLQNLRYLRRGNVVCSAN